MEEKMKGLIIGLILIVFGVSLIPVVFVAVGKTNWTIQSGTTTSDLSWVGYLIGLVFALAILAVGIGVFINAFKK
jgi:uncharacterized membrane protein